MTNVLKLDYDKIMAAGTKITGLGYQGDGGGATTALKRLYDTSADANYSQPEFLNLSEMSADININGMQVLTKIEIFGQQLLNAAEKIKAGDAYAASQCFKDAYRADALELNEETSTWYENAIDSYNVATAGYDALNLVAGDEIRASSFFKGIKTAAEASETITHILNKVGKLGKVLPFISAILAIGDLTEGTKGLMDESKEDWEEYQKTGDLADYAGNQTTTVIDNVIDIVAGGLTVAFAGVTVFGLIATAPAWATGLGIAATVAGGVWLGNKLIELATGKSGGEWIGDFVRSTGDAVENTWNAASDALNDVGSSIGNLFGW